MWTLWALVHEIVTFFIFFDYFMHLSQEDFYKWGLKVAYLPVMTFLS